MEVVHFFKLVKGFALFGSDVFLSEFLLASKRIKQPRKLG